MNGGTKTTVSLTALVALAVGTWQVWPVVDGVFFTELEAADFSEVTRRRHYQTQIDVLKLKQKHATTSADIAALQDQIDYYQGKIRELNEGAAP